MTALVESLVCVVCALAMSPTAALIVASLFVLLPTEEEPRRGP